MQKSNLPKKYDVFLKKLFGLLCFIILQFYFSNYTFAQTCGCDPGIVCVVQNCTSADPCIVFDHCERGPVVNDSQNVSCVFRDVCAVIYYLDADGDGYYNFMTSARKSPGQGWTTSSGKGPGDCNDDPAKDGFLINPDTKWYKDEDGDGYYTGAAMKQCGSPGFGYIYKNIKGGNDNCSTVANPDQKDTDGDGKGDACDPVLTSAVINPSQCIRSDGSITLSGLIPNTTYTVNYSYKGQQHSIADILSNASGSYTIDQLLAGVYSDITVTINTIQSDHPLIETLTGKVSPTWFSNITFDFTLCEGMTLNIAISGSTAPQGTTFQWFGPGSIAFPRKNDDPNFTLLDLTLANSGVYTGTAISPDYCTDTTQSSLTVVQSSNLAISTGSGTICQSVVIDGDNEAAYASGCSSISNFVRDINNPDALSGVVNTCVSVDDAINLANTQPYLQRHYDIEPQLNPSTSQATITLYALQSEFDAYNDYVNTHTLNLPLMPTNGIDNGNVRITQFHGTGTGPGNYSGATDLIVPNVAWNSISGWWELTFDVTGFSGFYIHSGANVLPLTLISFAGQLQNESVLIQWEAVNETSLSKYVLQKSGNGINFVEIQEFTVSQSFQDTYSFHDPVTGTSGTVFYRLKMIDTDGKFYYSNIIRLAIDVKARLLLFPNPAKNTITISGIEKAGIIKIENLQGKILQRKKIFNQSETIDISSLSKGVYMLEYDNGVSVLRQKFIKQ